MTQSRLTNARKGAATLELAICLPVLAVLVFGMIEACNAIFLKQALSVSAHEACRTAISRTGTVAAARQKATDVLAARGIQDATVQFQPSPESRSTGQNVTCTVSAPAASNSISPSMFYGGRRISASVTMNKE